MANLTLTGMLQVQRVGQETVRGTGGATRGEVPHPRSGTYLRMREVVSNREGNEERGGLLLAKEPSQLTLPLGPRRTGRTATRPRSYQYGTLDAEWQ